MRKLCGQENRQALALGRAISSITVLNNISVKKKKKKSKIPARHTADTI